MSTTSIRLFATTGDAVARLDSPDGQRWETSSSLEGSGSQCVAVDPHDPDRVFAGTFDQGLWRSRDGGASWQRVGEGPGGIAEGRVLSVAVSPSHRVDGVPAVYAGTEPSRLYHSEDDGATWRDFLRLPDLPSSDTWSFPPRPWTHHVRWIGLHHHDPHLIFAGIELGGVMRSRDGGATWEDRKPGSYHDSHAIATHPLDPTRVYEAAGGVSYDDATLHAILQLPDVVGIKVATLDSVMTFQRIARLMRSHPDTVLVTGADRFYGYSVRAGAPAALIGMGAALPDAQVELLQAFRDRQWERFVALSGLCDRLAQATFVEPMEGYIRRMLWAAAAEGAIPREACDDPWGPALPERERDAVERVIVDARAARP